ncbi:MAG: FG-GAP repeat protein [Saccharospirillaceae bacterium]|nr:integrin alpha [Pseudomonadales bacterium]NRB81809.1 FG-GAP repeat protein [Saccharospirillaceae bacterium]
MKLLYIPFAFLALSSCNTESEQNKESTQTSSTQTLSTTDSDTQTETHSSDFTDTSSITHEETETETETLTDTSSNTSTNKQNNKTDTYVSTDSYTFDMSDLTPEKGFTILSGQTNAFFGWAATGVGDVNNDGIDDFVIGAHSANVPEFDNGVVYLYLGKEGLTEQEIIADSRNESEAIIIHGERNNSYIGYSLSAAGDVNGDGIDDFILGTDEEENFKVQNFGAAYIIFGRNTWDKKINLGEPDNTSFVRIHGQSIRDEQLGLRVAGNGDFNGDNLQDIIVAAERTYINNIYTGAVYVIYGRSQWDSFVDVTQLNDNDGFMVEAHSELRRIGEEASMLNDINNDGLDEIMFSGYVTGEDSDAYCFIIYGTEQQISTKFNTSELDGNNGFYFKMQAGSGCLAIGNVGDINNDGLNDYAVGDSIFNRDNNFRTSEGAVNIIFGNLESKSTRSDSLTLDGSNGFSMYGQIFPDHSPYLGNEIIALGDFNGDGIDDFSVSERLEYGTKSIYIIFGSNRDWPAELDVQNLSESYGVTINWPAVDGSIAFSLNAAGDVNNDGYDDIILSDYTADHDNDEYNEGLVHIIYGFDPEAK